MKLVIDARYTRITHHDGISRYTAGLIAATSKLADVTMLINDTRQLAMLPDVPYLKISAPTSVLEPFVALQINKLDADVVFSPMQTMGTLGRKFPVILTLHDLIYYAHPHAPKFLPMPIRIGWFLFHQVYWPQRLLLNRADAVATVSNTTAGLMRKHRLTRQRIGLVSNAPTGDFARRDPSAKPKKTLLYMGSFMEYKNVETLVRAMAYLPEHELHLLSGIKEPRRQELMELIPNGAAVVFHDGVSDHEYEQLLSECTALVTLSREEGYGLPLVEAMSMGTPVVVTDMPIFREVAEDAALYASPDDARGFAEQVRTLDESATWMEYSHRAVQRAEHYSWERSAQQLLELAKYASDHRK
ncbi:MULTISPECIES: glycosyltransferase family 4 protein [Glutamicibacter]|uniref:Glycosyltransferase family 4 protein n=1 Tax=Glutamicibacter halophytocola TaxID=1933880 RepID=A0A5B8IN53_9MICC|nr:glycosyltransferase family 1 protein [Glutamicibacter halophytocola]MBF6671184.1 glycosyltransferase family 4 protein [Glutamicibacter sp. FBE19]ALG28434.1 mannosyltransferase [Glutamicibacter halophytocola]NQD42694.1 glycosyltransferase family 4 protein [Glutamicibacter halophytocola]QDY67722.1 glycosyltransferase family 4 protein [Glutamicibacter halophytocola]UUX59891.1 glycosyltransferase family 4 protein [Glutamicibacter halophytocola]